MELLEKIFDWQGLAQLGVDAVAYSVMAVVGTVFFLGRLGLSMIGGDGDVDGDTDGFDTDASFSLFSVLSILAFFMGAGWVGLACRLDWELGSLLSSVLAAGFGFAMMMAASGLMYALRRLNTSIEVDLTTAIGKTGRVYLTIPAHGEGHGQIEISVSGRKKILDAASTGPEIAAFADVKVIEIRDDEMLIVEPLS